MAVAGKAVSTEGDAGGVVSVNVSGAADAGGTVGVSGVPLVSGSADSFDWLVANSEARAMMAAGFFSSVRFGAVLMARVGAGAGGGAATIVCSMVRVNIGSVICVNGVAPRIWSPNHDSPLKCKSNTKTSNAAKIFGFMSGNHFSASRLR